MLLLLSCCIAAAAVALACCWQRRPQFDHFFMSSVNQELQKLLSVLLLL
jgi:hypothetical protein